jgi:Fe-S cluster assembly protein SufD
LSLFTADASAALGGPKWLARRRAEAFGRFEGCALPDESEEVWRYSGINSFDLDDFAPAPAPAPARAGGADLAAARSVADELGARSALVVTSNGAVSAFEASPTIRRGDLEVSSAVARSSGSEPPDPLGALVRAHDAFGELHDAFLADAVLVDVAAKAVLHDPVVVVHLVGSNGGLSGPERTPGPACFPRTVVRLGRSAQAGVVELSTGPAGIRSLVVPVTELEVQDDALLDYANLQVLGSSSMQVALQASRVAQHGVLRSFTAELGGGYARVRTDSDLVGEGAQSSLLAAYLGTGEQVQDFRTLQDHHGRRTRSELLFKGAVADRAHSVYSGLIRIARGAHGSDAFQTNHNLVLSEGAHADSVPNLDIDENDVRCSHASTVGPIDEEQLYYLQSRGVEPAAAERLVTLGFFSEIAGRAPFGPVGEFLDRAVRARLSERSTPGGFAAEGTGSGGRDG